MSRRKPNSHEQGQLCLPCRRCGAEPSQWCTTSSGATATYLHGMRSRDWRQIVGPALDEARADGAAWMKQAIAAERALRRGGVS